MQCTLSLSLHPLIQSRYSGAVIHLKIQTHLMFSEQLCSCRPDNSVAFSNAHIKRSWSILSELRPCMWRHSWQNNGILDVTRLFYSIQHGVVNGNDCSVHGKSQSSLFLDHNVSLNIYGSTTRPHNSNLSKYRVRVRSDSPRAGGYSIVSTLNAMSPATRHGVGNETSHDIWRHKISRYR